MWPMQYANCSEAVSAVALALLESPPEFLGLTSIPWYGTRVLNRLYASLFIIIVDLYLHQYLYHSLSISRSISIAIFIYLYLYLYLSLYQYLYLYLYYSLATCISITKSTSTSSVSWSTSITYDRSPFIYRSSPSTSTSVLSTAPFSSLFSFLSCVVFPSPREATQ